MIVFAIARIYSVSGTTIIYWSSTESATNAAWVQNFTDGTQSSYGKFVARATRAVRAF